MPRLRLTAEERRRKETEDSWAASQARTDRYYQSGELPEPDENEKANGKTKKLNSKAKVGEKSGGAEKLPAGVTLEDFSAFMAALPPEQAAPLWRAAQAQAIAFLDG